jgi:hypothetical protein
MLQHFSGVSAKMCHSWEMARFAGITPHCAATFAECTSAAMMSLWF